MNAVERALLNRAKKILIEAATEELEKYKKKLNDPAQTHLLNIFNSGILLDVNKIQRDGIQLLETRLKKNKKKN